LYASCAGDALSALGRYDEAIQNYQRAIAPYPQIGLKRALEQSGRPEE
jgi:tetratricopeptide (TPR) repeat protein